MTEPDRFEWEEGDIEITPPPDEEEDDDDGS